MEIVYILIAGLIGYICGAVPFGYIYVKLFKGIDIRTVGSGRTGGTNSYRAAGFSVGVLTGVSDILKGTVAAWITYLLFNGRLTPDLIPWAIGFSGLLSVIGHNWSMFMGFRGGAGTSPNIGWGAYLWWPMGPLGFGIMLGMLLTLGIASVASLTMAAFVPVVFGIRYFIGIDTSPAYLIIGIITALIITWSLRPNIKRLLRGEERVVGPRARFMRYRQQKQMEINSNLPEAQ